MSYTAAQQVLLNLAQAAAVDEGGHHDWDGILKAVDETCQLLPNLLDIDGGVWSDGEERYVFPWEEE